MSYLALARKYRPQTFDELIGQEFASTSLKNAIELDRVSHAYLFTGARGVGKTSAARIMAKALNCMHPVNNNPCNVCEHCLEITNGTSIDVIEIDGASNRGVDEIRQLRESVKFIPVKYKYKVYIVDEVHMLTDAASNALLKTLEEPPAYVVFIFATTDAHKIMPTILSRCQRYDFRRIPFDAMSDGLSHIFDTEKVEYDSNALNLIVRYSEGCFRDALSFSDQIIAYSNGKVTYEIVAQMLGISNDPLIGELYAAILKEDRSGLDGFISDLSSTGISLQYATERMVTHTRNLLLLINGGTHVRKELTTDELAYYDKVLTNVNEPRLFAIFQLLQKLYTDIKYSSFARYTFEFGVYKAASLSRIIPLPVQGSIAEQPAAAPQQVADKVATLARPSRTPVKDTLPPADKPQKSGAEKQDVMLTKTDKQWDSLIKELSSVSAGLASALSHAMFSYDDAGNVDIIFPKGRTFVYNRASTPDGQKLLKEFLESKLGTTITLNITLTGDEKKKALNDKKQELESLYEQQLRQQLSTQPVVKKIIDTFGLNPDEDIHIIKNQIIGDTNGE